MNQADPAGNDTRANPGSFLHIDDFMRSMSPLVDLPADPLDRRELFTELNSCGLLNRRLICDRLLIEDWKKQAVDLVERFNEYAEKRNRVIRLGEDELLTALLTSRHAQNILRGVDKKSQKLRPRRIVTIAQIMDKLR